MPSKFIPLGLSATGVDNTQWFDKLRCAADRGDVVCALDALRISIAWWLIPLPQLGP